MLSLVQVAATVASQQSLGKTPIKSDERTADNNSKTLRILLKKMEKQIKQRNKVNHKSGKQNRKWIFNSLKMTYGLQTITFKSKTDTNLSPCISKTEHLETENGRTYKSIVCDVNQPNHFQHLHCVTITRQRKYLQLHVGVGCELRFKPKFRYKNKIFFNV